VHPPKLLSDNGSSYLSDKLAKWLECHDMNHVRGTLYHPMTRGKIERWAPDDHETASCWKATIQVTAEGKRRLFGQLDDLELLGIWSTSCIALPIPEHAF
jgi:transposase InsO family protein